MKIRPLSSIIGIVIAACLCIGCSIVPENTAVSKDGVQIRYDVQGQGEPALVFVHGWGSERSRWEGQVAHFSDKHRVVTLDLAGFGESGNNRQDWTMEMYGEDVVSVLRHLQIDQAVLIGHSMGVAPILEVAKRLPKRIIGLVPVDMLQDVERKFNIEQIDQFTTQAFNSVMNPDREKISTYYKKGIDPEILERRVQYYKLSPKIGWKESLKEGYLWGNDVTNVLKELRVPIICINSDRQPTKIEVARKYVKSFDAKIVGGVGHSIMIDAPEVFNRLLEEIVEEFVSRVEAE